MEHWRLNWFKNKNKATVNYAIAKYSSKKPKTIWKGEVIEEIPPSFYGHVYFTQVLYSAKSTQSGDSRDNQWFVDIGATYHLAYTKILFIDFQIL